MARGDSNPLNQRDGGAAIDTDELCGLPMLCDEPPVTCGKVFDWIDRLRVPALVPAVLTLLSLLGGLLLGVFVAAGRIPF